MTRRVARQNRSNMRRCCHKGIPKQMDDPARSDQVHDLSPFHDCWSLAHSKRVSRTRRFKYFSGFVFFFQKRGPLCRVCGSPTGKSTLLSEHLLFVTKNEKEQYDGARKFMAVPSCCLDGSLSRRLRADVTDIDDLLAKDRLEFLRTLFNRVCLSSAYIECIFAGFRQWLCKSLKPLTASSLAHRHIRCQWRRAFRKALLQDVRGQWSQKLTLWSSLRKALPQRLKCFSMQGRLPAPEFPRNKQCKEALVLHYSPCT